MGQVAKVYSGVERRHWNDQKKRRFTADFKKAGGAGAPVSGHGAGDRGALRCIRIRRAPRSGRPLSVSTRCSRNPGGSAAASTRRRSGICTRRSASWRWSAFFSARVGALIRADRPAMVDRGCGLPLSRMHARRRQRDTPGKAGDPASDVAFPARMDPGRLTLIQPSDSPRNQDHLRIRWN